MEKARARLLKKDEHDVADALGADTGVVEGLTAAHGDIGDDTMASDSLNGVHVGHADAAVAAAAAAAAVTHTFTTLLTDHRKRESDSDMHEDEEVDEDDDVEDDPTRMLPIAEDDSTLVQCAHMEQCFESWEDFHRAMDEYCIATHQPMRLRTSDSAKAVNSRAAKRNSLKEPIDESVGFVKKLYLCTHGVKTKPRGKGKRPRQHYRYMGCPAMIRACISERKPNEGKGKDKYVVRVVAQVRGIHLSEKGRYVITRIIFDQINKHNHRLSEHLFKSYSESRVVIDDELVVPAGQGRVKDESLGVSPVTSVDAMPAPVSSSLEDHAMKTSGKFASTVLRQCIFVPNPMVSVRLRLVSNDSHFSKSSAWNVGCVENEASVRQLFHGAALQYSR